MVMQIYLNEEDIKHAIRKQIQEKLKVEVNINEIKINSTPPRIEGPNGEKPEWEFTAIYEKKNLA